jgi:hypothetical protein
MPLLSSTSLISLKEFRRFGLFESFAFLIIISILLSSCAVIHHEKPLDPRLTFSIGSSFLKDIHSLALKGRIDFFDGKAIQSGNFQMFFSGPDSLSFLIEGPLGVDVFRLVIISDSAFVLSNSKEGWITLGVGEVASITDFGIENFSPFSIALFAFPQYYSADVMDDPETGELTLQYLQSKLNISQNMPKVSQFSIVETESDITAVCSKRKDFESGFYPSLVTVNHPGQPWQIIFNITKLRTDPPTPSKIWARE